MSEATFEGNHPGPEWLSAWHDGELQEPASAAVRDHLDACAECREALEEYRRLDQAVQLGDDAQPDPETWEGIERRLRLRLEDELGLGVPMGVTRRYVESEADLVLLPTPQEVASGRGARPFRLRWAVATAAGLTVALLTLRMLSDSNWTLGTILNPAMNPPGDMHAAKSRPTVVGPRPTSPTSDARESESKQVGKDLAGNAVEAPGSRQDKPVREELSEPTFRGPEGGEADLGGAVSTLGKLEATPAPRDYLAEVDLATRHEPTIRYLPPAAASAPTPNEARSNDESAREVTAEKSKAAELSSAAPPPDPDYAMVFAAASRAREAGLQPLARRGFALVREGIPDDELAREAEYEEILATARMEIAAGTDPAVVAKRLEGDAAGSWAAVAPGEKPTCRKALAALRAAITMAHELGRRYAPDDADARLAQLRSCSR